jgi:hypothetical protein
MLFTNFTRCAVGGTVLCPVLTVTGSLRPVGFFSDPYLNPGALKVVSELCFNKKLTFHSLLLCGFGRAYPEFE